MKMQNVSQGELAEHLLRLLAGEIQISSEVCIGKLPHNLSKRSESLCLWSG
jgi:hypothetical protein